MNLRYLFPESNDLTAIIFGLPAFLVLVVTMSFLICDRTQGCGEQIWSSNVWGISDGNGFCEEDTHGTALLEEQNALSNFGFIYFGLVIFGLTFHDFWKSSDLEHQKKLRSHVTVTPILSVIYGTSMVYLGLGSFFFHGYGSSIAYSHDQASILVHMLIMIWFALLTYLPLDYQHTVKIKYTGIFISLITIIFMVRANIRFDITSEDVFPYYFGFIGSFIALLIMNACCRKFIDFHKFALNQLSLTGATFIFFILAFLVQEEFVVVRCRPTARFQFHALWHVICSIGFFVLYLFFRADDQRLDDEEDVKDESEEDIEKEDDGAAAHSEVTLSL